MKHALPVTITLFLLFIASQTVGLWILSQNMDIITDESGQVTDITPKDDWERPDLEGIDSVLYIVGAILVGTILLLIIIKFKKRMLWKVWFFVAVWLTIMLALGVFLTPSLALIIGLLLAVMKFYKPNIIIHNVTEVFLYSGIAVLLVPLLDLLYAGILLLVIAIYDFIAVFKSKHMVSMAKFQSTANVFAGLSIPYSTKTGNPVMASLKPLEDSPPEPPEGPEMEDYEYEKVESSLKTAILGGGDIAFPLIFSGVLMQELIQNHGLQVNVALGAALAVSLCAGIALLGLLSYGKKDRFYPAMPFISAGCFLGTGIVYLLI